MAYSDNERKLLSQFGITEFALSTGTVSEPMTFVFAGSNAFRNNAQGPAADALRRALVALNNGTVFRCTPEWEELIRFEE